MYNKVELIGYVGKKPETYQPPKGATLITFSVATDEYHKDSNGKKKSTEWHKVAVFGKLTDFCKNYLNKGDLVFVEGKLHTSNWEDDEGNKHSITEVRAEKVMKLSKKEDSANRENGEVAEDV
jgi:single-strand DNA-binding protein